MIYRAFAHSTAPERDFGERTVFFEVGMAHGQAMYIGGSGHPLMFLHQSLDRMMAAYFTLPHRGEAGLRIHLCKFD